MLISMSNMVKRKLIDIAEKEGLRESAERRIMDVGLKHSMDEVLNDVMAVKGIDFLVSEYESRNGVES